MPCVSYTPEEAAYDASIREAKTKNRLDLATRLLCKVCGELEKNDQIKDPELLSWWEEHKKMDKARIAAEKKAALEAEIKRQEEIDKLEAKLKKLKSKKK